ncbi:MAG TPA: hypothetical protein VEH10_06035, partial [Thermoplasmata archaeon]|nr:hypothetical protein [Thermoplasmata archaeon]
MPAGSLPTYSITFTGTGLPNGSTWDATLNGTSDSLVGVIPATVAPRGFLYDGLNSRLYLATTNSSSVAVIDPTTNSVVGSIPVGADPRYLALDPTSDYVYVTNTMSNNVTVING